MSDKEAPNTMSEKHDAAQSINEVEEKNRDQASSQEGSELDLVA